MVQPNDGDREDNYILRIRNKCLPCEILCCVKHKQVDKFIEISRNERLVFRLSRVCVVSV